MIDAIFFCFAFPEAGFFGFIDGGDAFYGPVVAFETSNIVFTIDHVVNCHIYNPGEVQDFLHVGTFEGWVCDFGRAHVFFDFVLGDGDFVEVRCYFMFVVVGFREGHAEKAEDGLFAFYFEGPVVGAVHFVYDFLFDSWSLFLGGGGFVF